MGSAVLRTPSTPRIRRLGVMRWKVFKDGKILWVGSNEVPDPNNPALFFFKILCSRSEDQRCESHISIGAPERPFSRPFPPTVPSSVHASYGYQPLCCLNTKVRIGTFAYLSIISCFRRASLLFAVKKKQMDDAKTLMS